MVQLTLKQVAEQKTITEANQHTIGPKNVDTGCCIHYVHRHLHISKLTEWRQRMKKKREEYYLFSSFPFNSFFRFVRRADRTHLSSSSSNFTFQFIFFCCCYIVQWDHLRATTANSKHNCHENRHNGQIIIIIIIIGQIQSESNANKKIIL